MSTVYVIVSSIKFNGEQFVTSHTTTDKDKLNEYIVKCSNTSISLGLKKFEAPTGEDTIAKFRSKVVSKIYELDLSEEACPSNNVLTSSIVRTPPVTHVTCVGKK